MTLPVAGKFVPGGPGIYVADVDGIETPDGTKLSGVLGSGPLIALLSHGTTGSGTATRSPARSVVVENSADTGFVIRVDAAAALYTGAALHSQDRVLDGVTWDLDNADSLRYTGDGTDKAYSVYKIGSLSALRAAMPAAGGGGLPVARASDVGRVMSVASDRSPFWDLARDVLLRALGSLAGHAGKLVGVNSDEDDIELVSLPDLVDVIPDSENLPPLANYPDSQVILHRGELYHKGTVTSSISFSFRSGEDVAFGRTRHGVIAGEMGQFIVNPDHRYDAGLYDDGNQLELFILDTAYRAAKGSNEAIGDQLTAAIVTDETPSGRSVTKTFTFRGSGVTNADGRHYLYLSATRANNVLDRNARGHTITVTLSRGGNAFLRVPGTHEGWTPVSLAQIQALAKVVASNERDADGRLAQLSELLVDLRLGSGLNTSAWANDTTVDNGMQKRRSSAWTLAQANAAASGQWLKSTIGEREHDGEYVAIRLVHALDPRAYRLQIQRSDGSTELILLSQLWNIGNASGLTYKFFTRPDLLIYRGDFVQLQKAGAVNHLGQTEYAGKLDTGQVSDALISLVADEAAYDAITAKDADTLYLW